MHRKTLLPLALAAALGPALLPAQDLGMIEGLFDEVTAITVSYQGGWATSPDVSANGMLHGAATEVLINLRSSPRMSYELGLGASYLRGYQAAEPTMDLRATLRALPTVSLYATREGVLGPLSMYAGGSFGLVELWNAQAYGPSGQPWDVEARAFELGGSLGVYLGAGPLQGLFAEGGYRSRDFQSVRYTPRGDEELPASWPRSLDFSGPVLSLGWQLQLDPADDEGEDAASVPPAGAWVVQRVDGAPLPALLDSASTGRRKVVHGVLRLRPEEEGSGRGEWRMELHLRERGGLVRVDQPSVRSSTVVESGTYETTADGVLRLTEAAARGEPRLAERLHGRIYLQWRGHVLLLAPGSGPAEGGE